MSVTVLLAVVWCRVHRPVRHHISSADNQHWSVSARSCTAVPPVGSSAVPLTLSTPSPSAKHQQPDLLNILRQSYDNPEVTIHLQWTSYIQNIL